MGLRSPSPRVAPMGQLTAQWSMTGGRAPSGATSQAAGLAGASHQVPGKP
jgi:hypothetical protein